MLTPSTMDNEQPENNKSVCNMIHDFDKSSEKIKTQRSFLRENTLISFAMKAVARDQESHIVISRLQRELAKAQGMLNLLELENDIKDQLVKDKEEEIKVLKNKVETLKDLTGNNNAKYESLNVTLQPSTGETPSKINKLSDVVISTQSNIVVVASPSAGNRHDIHDIVSSSKVESSQSKVVSPKPKPKIVKKKSIRKTKEIHVSSFLYNLRNRTKSKKISEQL